MVTSEQRFWKKVHKTANDACWNWIGGKTTDNYGSFWFQEKPMKAHKVSYLIFRGNVPEGVCVLHNCDNSLCVNPTHLRLGTQRENIKDRVERKRNGDHSGEKAGLAKLTWSKVRDIRKLKESSSLTQEEIAVQFKVSRSTIGRLLNNKTWII